MFLAFYKMFNSKGYTEHAFDNLANDPWLIRSMLSELSDNQLRIYNLDDDEDVDAFVKDYNEENLFTPKWWCVLLRQ